MTKFVKNLSADQFNMLYPVGSEFVYYSRKNDLQGKPCVTRSEAWVLKHGCTVVSISGASGGIAITHLALIQSDPVWKEINPSPGYAVRTASGTQRVCDETQHAQPHLSHLACLDSELRQQVDQSAGPYPEHPDSVTS